MHQPRKRSLARPVLMACLLVAMLMGFSAPADAGKRVPYSMEILVDGVSLEQLSARNATYIQALEGREYSVRLTNHTGQRIAVALSVDGLNSIDAKATTAREASKWILGPHSTITLDGWQTSSDTARRFYFTTEENSYGAWLGKTSNLGIISAAVFRERPLPRPKPLTRNWQQENKRDGRAGRYQPPASEAPRSAGLDAPSAAEQQESLSEAPSDDLAATGIGRELDHQVRRVSFRAESVPAATMSVRYEYRDALIALGVLPQPSRHLPRLSRRENARGFTDSTFAPDPFAHN